MAGAHLLGFYFVHVECVTCLVHESCVVFRHNAVYSTQGSLFLLDPQDLSPAAIPSIHTSLALTPTILFCCFPVFGTQVLLSRAWSRYLLLGLVRVLPCDLGNKSCISLVLNYLAGILSVDDLYGTYLSVQSLQVPVLIFRSPGVAKNKYG